RSATLVNASRVCETGESLMNEDSKMNRVSALRASVSSGALFRAAFLTVAGIVVAASPADAAVYWQNPDSGYYGAIERPQPPRRPQRARSAPKKQETKV